MKWHLDASNGIIACCLQYTIGSYSVVVYHSCILVILCLCYLNWQYTLYTFITLYMHYILHCAVCFIRLSRVCISSGCVSGVLLDKITFIYIWNAKWCKILYSDHCKYIRWIWSWYTHCGSCLGLLHLYSLDICKFRALWWGPCWSCLSYKLLILLLLLPLPVIAVAAIINTCPPNYSRQKLKDTHWLKTWTT